MLSLLTTQRLFHRLILLNTEPVARWIVPIFHYRGSTQTANFTQNELWKELWEPCLRNDREPFGKLVYGQPSHHVVQVDEGVVDGHHLDLASGSGGTGHQTADTSESETQEDAVSTEKRNSAGSQQDQCVQTSLVWQFGKFKHSDQWSDKYLPF